jgi:hypothetical protein
VLTRPLGVADAFVASIVGVNGPKKAPSSGAAGAEAVRVRRLREDAQRPISVNLAETIALSHKLMRFAGAARRS